MADKFARITRQDIRSLLSKKLSQHETVVFLAYRFCCWDREAITDLVELCDLAPSRVQQLVTSLREKGLLDVAQDLPAQRVSRTRTQAATQTRDPAIEIQQIKTDLNTDPPALDLLEGSHAHTRESHPEKGRAGDQDLIAYLCKLFSIGEKLARRLVAKGSALCAEVPGGTPTVAEWKRFAFWAANEPTLAKSEAKFAASIDRLVPWLIQFRSTTGNRAANDAARGARSVLAPSESAQAAGSLVALLERNRGLDRRDQGGAG